MDDNNSGLTYSEDDSFYHIKGYPIVFNKTAYVIVDHTPMIEVIKPEAVDESILKTDILLVFNHDTSRYPLARTSNHTMTLKKDEKGVYMEADMPKGLSEADDLYTNIKVGNINKMSVDMLVDKSTEQRYVKDGVCYRVINKLKAINEVSAVTRPAYNDTSLEARSASIEGIIGDGIMNAEEIIKLMAKGAEKRGENMENKENKAVKTEKAENGDKEEVTTATETADENVEATPENEDEPEDKEVGGKDLESKVAELEKAIAELTANAAQPAVASDEPRACVDEKRSASIAAEYESRMAGTNMNVLGKYDLNGTKGGANKMENESKFEKRGAALKAGEQAEYETRALLFGTAGVEHVTETSRDVKSNFAPVSSILDEVKTENHYGVTEHKVVYQKTELDAKDYVDGTATAESDVTFGTVTIDKKGVKVLSFISEDAQTFEAADYDKKVQESLTPALRKKITPIVVNAVYAAEDGMVVKKTLSAIVASTLRDIMLSYGVDDYVNGDAKLYMNKKDLIAFGDVKDGQGLPAYKITPDANGNTGTLQEREGGVIVRYTLVSVIKDFASATAGDNIMFYGNPKNLELDAFSPLTTESDKSYKFADDQITFKSKVNVGAAVIVPNGFTVYQKAAA